jgi:hypothetical protein
LKKDKEEYLTENKKIILKEELKKYITIFSKLITLDFEEEKKIFVSKIKEFSNKKLEEDGLTLFDMKPFIKKNIFVGFKRCLNVFLKKILIIIKGNFIKILK